MEVSVLQLFPYLICAHLVAHPTYINDIPYGRLQTL